MRTAMVAELSSYEMGDERSAGLVERLLKDMTQRRKNCRWWR